MAHLALDDSFGFKPKLTKHIKRNFNTWCKCIVCGTVHCLSDKTIGYQCKECQKYNSVSNTKVEYNDNLIDDITAPKVIRTTNVEYTKFRDEMQIRSDFFQKGVRRETVGLFKFRKMLKTELIRNKCYRGKASDVD